MKNRLLTILRNLHKDQSGQDLVEYALAAACIALGAVAGMQTLALSINSSFSIIGSHLTASLS